MRKLTLCLLMLLSVSGANSFGQETKTKDSAPPPLPKIIRTIALTGQTDDIPQTTIFTPTNSGLIRVSVYITITVPSPQLECLSVPLTWADDAGPKNAIFTNQSGVNFDCSPGVETDSLNFGFETLVIRASAGTPVTYQASNIQAGTTTYELFITVEQLM